jgi:hypothetical protein
MNLLPSTRIVVISLFLVLPALLLCVCGVLYTAFGLESANNFLGSILPTSVGKVLLSPVSVLGGVFAALALNLWAACRVRVGVDTGTVYVTFYVARALRHLIFAAFAMLLAALLLAYAFVENFSIVAR